MQFLFDSSYQENSRTRFIWEWTILYSWWRIIIFVIIHLLRYSNTNQFLSESFSVVLILQILVRKPYQVNELRTITTPFTTDGTDVGALPEDLADLCSSTSWGKVSEKAVWKGLARVQIVLQLQPSWLATGAGSH